MSHSAWLKIKFWEECSSAKALKSLLADGWSLNYDGFISYLPIGDKGRYDWTYVPYDPINIEEFYKMAQYKEEIGETVGIVLARPEEGVGVDVLMYGKVVDISLSINRKSLTLLQDVTDVTWYLERLLPALSKCAAIGAIYFEEGR